MTDATTPAPTENVGQGALFALATIPLAIVLYAVIGGLFGFFAGIVAFIVPPAAAWLYERGAGAPLTRRGWPAIIGISIVSILLGILAGFVGTAYAAYSAVGNREPFGSAFWTTVRLQLTGPDAFLPILLGLVFGAIALVGLLRRPRPAVQKAEAEAAALQAQQAQPVPPQQPTLNPGPTLNAGPTLNPGPSVQPQQPTNPPQP
jgi:hypothetical protein